MGPVFRAVVEVEVEVSLVADVELEVEEEEDGLDEVPEVLESVGRLVAEVEVSEVWLDVASVLADVGVTGTLVLVGDVLVGVLVSLGVEVSDVAGVEGPLGGVAPAEDVTEDDMAMTGNERK